MFITRTLTPKALRGWLTQHSLWMLLFNTAIAVIYVRGHFIGAIPWLPVSVIGTAVAFFLTFKSNQAYDRVWEARKLWGSIVNSSRTWSTMVISYVRPFDAESAQRVQAIRTALIHRHIAWLYQHRNQLLERMTWEQVGASNFVARRARGYAINNGLGRFAEQVREDHLDGLLDPAEAQRIAASANPATQLIHEQSLQLAELRAQGYFTDFNHMQLADVLRSFYDLQGANERIKKFPFLRDYSTMSKLIVYLFVFLMPFSLIPEMLTTGHWAFWLSIPIATMVGMVFVVMEELGDYNENPFMGTPNGMPMLSICRSIEIDLRQMLGEKEIPKPIAAVDDVLM